MHSDLRTFFRRLIQWATSPPQPGGLYCFLEASLMSNRFRVHVLLPAIPEAERGEVALRKLVRTVNETGHSEEFDIPLDQPEFVFEALQGDRIHLKLVHVDDAGNRSQPSHYEFTVIDNTPPSQPGEMMVHYTEVPDDPAATPPAPPAPPAADPPAGDPAATPTP